jgi:NADH:ubiquinone oxidoreductase subunit E
MIFRSVRGEPAVAHRAEQRKELTRMRVITVCVGSACHLKGSHSIINYFKNAIQESGLENEVELKGTFCMDKCTDGANLLVDEELFHANSVEEAQQIFETQILQKRK